MKSSFLYGLHYSRAVARGLAFLRCYVRSTHFQGNNCRRCLRSSSIGIGRVDSNSACNRAIQLSML
jgi:hypothetical protein